MADNEEVRMTLRLPKSIHNRLISKAMENSRSVNAEIIKRLERTVTEEDEYSNIYEFTGELDKRLDDVEYKIGVLWDIHQGRDPYNPRD